MNKYWVVINKDVSIYNGECIPCADKIQALNVATAVARSFYIMGIREVHIFVIENVDTVKYHYEVLFEKNNKMILLYEGMCNNRKIIEKQVIK